MVGENQMFFIHVNMSFAFLMTLQQMENDFSASGGKDETSKALETSDMEAGGDSTLKQIKTLKAASHTVCGHSQSKDLL